jgi:hypothetical protein
VESVQVTPYLLCNMGRRFCRICFLNEKVYLPNNRSQFCAGSRLPAPVSTMRPCTERNFHGSRERDRRTRYALEANSVMDQFAVALVITTLGLKLPARFTDKNVVHGRGPGARMPFLSPAPLLHSKPHLLLGLA